ncbi:hypothetical protein AB0J48_35375 [Nocardia salmonicida]|uniref:hypothetical protein n=1 Tax=Nocardia salmonicida TaxID=53431 RepID=UPI00343C3D6F
MSMGSQADSEDSILLPEDQLRRWAAFTYQIRACELVLARTVDPVVGSTLHQADAIYPREKVSAWARSYLLAAAEHLGFWADLVAPYEFDADTVNKVRFRQYLMLGRSGWEAAAHAVWLLDVPTGTFEECVQRFVRLMHRDFNYHRDALVADGADTEVVDLRIANLADSADRLPFDAPRKPNPPGYKEMIRNAATIIGADVGRWTYLWNAASGATHGQDWFGIEGFDLLAKAEYEPGFYRTVSTPDPTFITETFEAASETLMRGTVRVLQFGGHDPTMLATATREIFERMPKKNEQLANPVAT